MSELAHIIWASPQENLSSGFPTTDGILERNFWKVNFVVRQRVNDYGDDFPQKVNPLILHSGIKD